MKILFGDIVLSGGDAVDESPIDFQLSTSRVVQTVYAIRASHSNHIDRGNASIYIEFRVKKKHKCISDAQVYILSHCAQLDGLINDMIIYFEPSEQRYILSDAVVSSSECKLEGNVSDMCYKIIGGSIQEG